jgi:GxxExxY protein
MRLSGRTLKDLLRNCCAEWAWFFAIKKIEPRVNTDKIAVNALVELVIGRAFVVSNTLGAGFLEKVYENALAHELRKAGLRVEQHRAIDVHYDSVVVGTYIADLFVEDVLVIELKAVKQLDAVLSAQCLNYLRATGLWLALTSKASPALASKRNAKPSPASALPRAWALLPSLWKSRQAKAPMRWNKVDPISWTGIGVT